MALTFPRPLPSELTVRDFVFDLMRFDSVDFARNGHMTATQIAPPMWTVHWETPPLEPLAFGAVDAWLDTMRGSQRTFLCHNPARVYPVSYDPRDTPGATGFAGLVRAVGGTSFADGACTFASITSERDGFSLSALPAVFKLRVGDMVSLQWTVSSQPRRSLHRIVENVDANGFGVAPVLVEPTLIGLVPSSGVASLLKPDGIFRMDPANPPTRPKMLNHTGIFTFDAIQAQFRT